MARIQILPAALSDQIAAGEVVERPSSVAKELLENALDAGATRIVVDFELGGVKKLRIVDNGSGMTSEDAILSVKRHATSKIASLADLEQIGTLGFRGEALASISSVSQFRLRTRRPDAIVAVQVALSGGEALTISETGAPIGTEVVVEDLFFNVPARRKFLKKPETEASHIIETVQRLAICYPQVAFKVIRDKKVVLEIPSHQTLLDRLGDMFPRGITSTLKSFSIPGAFGLSGCVGDPREARGSTRHYYLFVNGRIVKDRVLMSAIQSGCGHLLSKGKHPFAVLCLSLPSQAVDVNVHPAKTEVRFADSRQIFRMVARSVESALQRNTSNDLLAVSNADTHRVSALDVKEAVEADLRTTSGANAATKLGGLSSQKRRVFDAMARLAQKKHSTGMQAKAPLGEVGSSLSLDKPSMDERPIKNEGPAPIDVFEAQLPLEVQPASRDIPKDGGQERSIELTDAQSKEVKGFQTLPMRSLLDDSLGDVASSAEVARDGVELSFSPREGELAIAESESGPSRMEEARFEVRAERAWFFEKETTPLFCAAGFVGFLVDDVIRVLDVGAVNRELYQARAQTVDFEHVHLSSPILMQLNPSRDAESAIATFAHAGIIAESFGAHTLRLSACDSTIALAVGSGQDLLGCLYDTKAEALGAGICRFVSKVDEESWREVFGQLNALSIINAAAIVLNSGRTE